MGYLDSLFENKAARKTNSTVVDVRNAISRSVAGTNNMVSPLLDGKWDIERSVDKAYERVVWVFRCVDAIASAAAGIPMQKREYDTEAGHKVEDKNLNKLLNRKTNAYENSWAFRYRLSSLLLLSTKGVFVEKVKNSMGETVQMFILDIGSTEPIRDAEKYVSGYKVKRADGSYEILDPDDVIWLKIKNHPIDAYRQMTALIPAGVSVDTDYLARLFNRNFLRNDGRPGLLIGIKGDLNSEDGDEIRALFNGGYTSAGAVRVIESDGLDVIDLSAKPRDAQWQEATQSSKEEILGAFGVPESVLGNSAGKCLRASENVFLATGEIKRAEELVGKGFRLLQPQQDSIRVVKATAEYALEDTIYKLTTFSGRTIQVNGAHPLYMAVSTPKGPFKRDIHPWGWTHTQTIKRHFDQNDACGFPQFTEVAVPIHFEQLDAVPGNEDEYFNLGKIGKELPNDLFVADIEVQRSFLSGLYTDHGLLSQHTSFDVYVPTREYAINLQRLLVRIGVGSVINTKKLRHVVEVSGKVNMFNLLSQLRLTGVNLQKAKNVWDRLKSDTHREQNAYRTDGLPPGLVWDRVLSVEDMGVDRTVAITIVTPQTDNSYLSMFWEHNTYNSSQADDENFWTKTMVPHCDAIAREFESLTNDEDDETYIAYDYSVVDVLQRIKRRREDEAKQDFARGVITLNQLLVIMGLPEIDHAYGRVYFHPSRMIGGVNTEDILAASLLPVIGVTAQPGPGVHNVNPFLNNTSTTGGDGQVGAVNDIIQGQLAANGTDIAGQTVNDQAARTLRSGRATGVGDGAANPNAIVEVRERIDRLLARDKKTLEPVYEVKQLDYTTDPHKDLRLGMKGLIEGALDSWSNRQLEVVADRVGHVKVRKGTRHWDGDDKVVKTLDVDYVVNVDEWVEEFKAAVVDKVSANLYREANRLNNTLSDSGYKFVDVSDSVEKSLQLLEDAVRKQTNLVHKHIATLDNAGDSIDEIKSTLVAQSFDRNNWSSNLAAVVTTNAIESLYYEVYSKVGGAFKIWCSGEKEHYREGHSNSHGVKKLVADSFDINESKILYPSHNLDNEALGCSCWLYYGVDK